MVKPRYSEPDSQGGYHILVARFILCSLLYIRAMHRNTNKCKLVKVLLYRISSLDSSLSQL